jgi:hypothetical protein
MRVPHVSRDVGTPSNDELERQSRPVGSRVDRGTPGVLFHPSPIVESRPGFVPNSNSAVRP